MIGDANEDKRKFEEYSKVGKVPSGGFSREQLKTHQKAKKILEIIDLVEKDIKNKASKLFEEFNVNFEFTSSDNSKFSEQIVNSISFENNHDVDKKDLAVAVNFNFSKLGMLPPEEAYAVVYSCMYNTLLKKRDLASSNSEVDFKKGSVNQTQNDADNKETNSIFEYIKKFLENFFLGNDDIKNMDYSACAKAISLNFKQHGLSSKDLFENPNGKNLFAERFAKVSKLGYQQQATALAGVFSKKEFNAIQNGSNEELKDFCNKFADQFLQNSGLSQNSYTIEFGETRNGDLGTYIDNGVNGQKIIINIDEIRKFNNPAEVLMTLAHELTHMVDSSKNKAEGKASRKGLGLTEHNLVGSVNDNAPDFVKRMQEVYYEANPHERSARQGELVALEFMMQMQPDETMKKYISKSIKSFQAYQRETLKTLQQRVDLLINEYESKSFSYDAKTMQYIERVMDDLKKMKDEGLLDVSEDLKALKESQQIQAKVLDENAVSTLGE